jgi:hypothetical protein
MYLPEDLSAEELRGWTESLFNAEQLVVFRDAIGAARRARLNLAGIGGDREIGDKRVFRLA